MEAFRASSEAISTLVQDYILSRVLLPRHRCLPLTNQEFTGRPYIDCPTIARLRPRQALVLPDPGLRAKKASLGIIWRCNTRSHTSLKKVALTLNDPKFTSRMRLRQGGWKHCAAQKMKSLWIFLVACVAFQAHNTATACWASLFVMRFNYAPMICICE